MDFAHVAVSVATSSPAGTTNAYVLGRESALLVDPPAPHPDLDAVLAARDLGHVAVTHHHPDHVGAVARYADEHGATVWSRMGRERAFADATGVDPDRTFADGTVIPTGEGPVCVLDTPGHAPEHVAFEFADGNGGANGGNGGNSAGVVVGDLAVETGSVVVGAPEGDMRAYLTSLRRLHGRAPDTLYPGHGPRIAEPRRTLARLVRHRLRRERRVLAAVREGARTVDDIVDAAYDKDLTGVREMAAATVKAHLEKLAVEGKVGWDGERAVPVE